MNNSLNLKLFDDDIEQVPSRNGFGEGLVIAGEENPNVVGLCADLTESTRFVSGSWTKILPYVGLNNDSEQVKAIKQLDESGIKLKNE